MIEPRSLRNSPEQVIQVQSSPHLWTRMDNFAAWPGQSLHAADAR